MQHNYYKIPAEFVARLGLTGKLVAFPDGRYLCTGAVMARIHPDIDRALEITGGIALSLDEARDEQRGLTVHPLPGDPAPTPADAPLYTDDPEPEPSENTVPDCGAHEVSAPDSAPKGGES